MHRVPKARRDEKATVQPELSEAPIELEAKDKSYLDLRMRATLGGYARPVVESPDEDSPTPELVKGLLTGGKDLVAASREIAMRLHERQPSVSSEGLLLVIEGTLDGKKAVLISKIEHEQGMRVEPSTTKDGKRTFKAQYLRDLIFSQSTKVYKVGVFTGTDEAKLLRGYVVDVQQTAHGAAHFFVHTVLGCVFTQRPDVLTEKFKTTAEKWINKQIKDPEKKATYEIALLADLQSPKKTLSVSSFAQQHIADSDDRDSFLSSMQSAGVPKTSMPKDTALIAGSIRRFKVQTKRNATIMVPPEMYADGTLSILDRDDDARSEITVIDEISGMSGASGRPENSS